jgi:hypothetical protein
MITHKGAAAVFLLAISIPCVAWAAGRGGVGGGGHVGGGAGHVGGGGAPHVGGGGIAGGGVRGGVPSIGRSVGVPSLGGRSLGVRSLGGPSLGGSRVTRFNSRHIGGVPLGARQVGRIGPSRVGAGGTLQSTRIAPSAIATHSISKGLSGPAGRLNRPGLANLGRSNPALHHRALVNPAFRSVRNTALARSAFAGRFAANRFWWHRHHGLVVGWFGPLFWPYAYNDFIDYSFWPYAYDVFWPYAYDDVYNGIFGPYSYGYETTGTVAQRRRSAGSASRSVAAQGICGERVPAWADWPVERIARDVMPDASQQSALDELKGATAKAVGLLQSACPSEVMSTPVGRMAAVEQRLDVMLQAVQAVRPALDKFFGALSDEQKARFNVIGAEAGDARVASRERSDLAQVCGARAPSAADVPTDRVAAVVQPTPAQQPAFDKLKAAGAEAATILKANCETSVALTPTGRVAAMQARLEGALKAIRMVKPALSEFYQSLSDEQKARFNTIGS